MLSQLCREALDKNRVVEERRWNRTKPPTLCTFHAPLLSHPRYPSWLPSPLNWLWRIGWDVALPFRVGYPHQWLWDSCAHATVLSHIDIELAQQEIFSLLYAQQDDGFIPHLIWNKKSMHWVDRMSQPFYPRLHFSPFIQPPALASAVEAIFLHSQNMGFLREVLPHVQAYYLHLEKTRSKGEDGLLEIIISYEGGRDRSPEYDEVYGSSTANSVWPMVRLLIRYYALGWNEEKIFHRSLFRVKDLLLNCVYVQNLLSLSRLLELVGEDKHRRLLLSLAERCEESILGKMYDDRSGLFYSLDSRQGGDKRLPVNTISSLFPLILPHIPEEWVERLVKEHLLNPQEYWTPYPLPAVPLMRDKPLKMRHVIWRGPQTWVYSNWYIVKGLRKQAQRFSREEYKGIADHITTKTEELILREGFHDFYDSQTGRGSGVSPFSWSTLILDMA